MMTLAKRWEIKGKKEGIKEGEKKGIKEGEKKTKWSVVKNALRKGLPINDIAEILNTTTTQVKRIITQIEKETYTSSSHAEATSS